MHDVQPTALGLPEEALALEEIAARYRALLEASLDAVVAVDADGLIVDFNRAAERIFGYPAAEVIGGPLSRLIPEAERDAHAAEMDCIRTSGSPGRIVERRAVRLDGSVVTVEMMARPAMSDAGATIVACLRDVTDQRRVREDITRLARENELILNAAGDGIVRVDADGKVSFINAAAESILGWSSEELIGRPIHGTVHHSAPDGSPYPESTCPVTAAGKDGSVHRVETDVFWTKDGRWVPVEFISAPLWQDGRIVGSVVTFRDVTRRRAAEDEVRRSRDTFRFLARVTSVLGEAPLDPEQRLRVLAREFVPALVDWCAIDLVDEAGVLRRVVVEHVDPGKVALAHEIQERYPSDPDAATGAWAVMRTGQSQLIEHVSDELLVQSARDDDHLKLLRSLGIDSVLVVPMRARDRVLGTVTLVTAESRRHLTPADIITYEEVGSRAGILIDNARLFVERSHVAQTLQQSLLPPVLPVIDGVDVAARYVAAADGVDVGGDFYDIFETDPGDWAVVLGDVSGKGADAAAMTALARYTIRAAAIGARKPSSVLATLNRAVLQQQTDRFCTACYVRVRPSAAGVRLTVCRGGHPRPLVLRAAGRLEELPGEGTALGLFPDVALTDRSARLRPGDSLILFTDGVTEARGERGLLGERTLRAFLRSCVGKSADEIAGGVEHLAIEWQQGRPRDDIAVVVMQAPRSRD